MSSRLSPKRAAASSNRQCLCEPSLLTPQIEADQLPPLCSVIALDRYWALNEVEGIDGDVVVGWAYDVSPRNLVVVASKGAPRG